MFNVKVAKNGTGEWQADLRLPDGRELHSVGREPGEALARLGRYWLDQSKPNDMADLARAMLEARK